jgi:uncharacterized protein
MMRQIARRAGVFALASFLAIAPAQAQFSDSYDFLKAVRDRDGDKATKAIDKPGSQTINTRDYASGETALHIVVKRRDSTWLAFLLSKGAKPDLRDKDGNTALAAAARIGFVDGVTLLIAAGAPINGTNDAGETPLIIAVQARDLQTVRVLLANGADPKIADHIAGMSARDYAARDPRSGTILKTIDDTKPAKPKAPVQGPKP